jgi:hypothetical protein
MINQEVKIQRTIQSKKRYLFAFLIGTFIFLFGFSLTYSISYLEFQRISNFQETTSYNIFQDKLEHSLFNEDICSINTFKKISEDLGFQGRIIDDLEKKFGKNNKEVLFKKKFYSLVELEHFEFINQINKECEKNIPTILFFYSNLDKDLEKGEDAGRILGVISERNKDLIIYSFDINLDSDLVKKLLEKYNIKKSPTIIINGKEKVENFKNINNVEKYLENNTPNEDNNIIRL